MTHIPVGQRQPAHFARGAAFTIIEMLTVITIILILAGLILGIAGNAQNKAATSRATSEIQAFSAAAENYKIDNGTYPRTANTDGLNARQSYDPSGTTGLYAKSSLDFYKLISGAYYTDPTSGTLTVWPVGSTSIPKPTIYFLFKDSQLQNSGTVTSGYINPTSVQAIVDPFGFSYGYSTIYLSESIANPTTTPTDGYNPTFDLWSTAGYSASGKPYPTPPGNGSTTATYNTLWIKNW